jgi:hypothetical protein
MEFIMSTKVNVFITPLNDNKYVCIANNEPIAKSNDATYFERHYSTNSIKKLENVDVDKFIYLTPTGRVDHIDLVSKSDGVISRIISKLSKPERIQLRREGKVVIDIVKTMKMKLA